MFGATDNLSKAASRIWLAETQPDPYDAMGYDADCGPLIERSHQIWKLRVLAEYGFTPETYNAELRQRMCGDEYPKMSYSVFHLLRTLEVESPLDWYLSHTSVETCGEQSSLGYLYGDPSELSPELRAELESRALDKLGLAR